MAICTVMETKSRGVEPAAAERRISDSEGSVDVDLESDDDDHDDDE